MATITFKKLRVAIGARLDELPEAINRIQDAIGNAVVSVSNVVDDVSGANTGDVTLTAVGATPSANGASLAGQALTLQPASATLPGIVTALAQTIAGLKTFTSKLVVSLAATGYGMTVVVGSSEGGFYSDGLGTWVGSKSSHPLFFFTADGSANAAIDTSGRWSIGSSVPDTSYRLYINGNTRAAGTIDVANAVNSSVSAGATGYALNATAGAKLKFTADDNTASPGNVTSDKPSGKAAIAVGTAASTVTSNTVTTASCIHVTPLDLNATLTTWKAVPGVGTFTVTGNANATVAAWGFSYLVVN